MSITMLLADAAQAVDGKLYILGGGWGITQSPTPPMAVAIKVEVPWNKEITVFPWKLELLDTDGNPAPTQDNPLSIMGEIETLPPPAEATDSLPPGTPLRIPLAYQFQSLPLEPGQYEWRFTFGNETHATSFLVQPKQ